MKANILLPILALAGCATTPLAPHPTVDLAGPWTIAAVDGEPTGGGRTFTLTVNPSTGSAQFGCNRGGGPLAVSRGWFVPGDPWISTVAGCPNRENWRYFERKGFQILAQPLAIERRPGGRVLLRNDRGSILLNRRPLPRLAGTRWLATSMGPESIPPQQHLVVTFTEREWQATAGCNNARAIYSVSGNQLRLGGASTTERGCAEELMAFEDRAFRILSGGTIIASERPGELILDGPRGSMSLQRLS